ncbi:MAG TPA: hypothetical protein VIH05_04620, partial [Tepidiformaceae bacterium]
EVVFGRALTSGEIQVEGSVPMKLVGQGEDGTCRYTAEFVSDAGGAVGYTIRLMPSHPDLHNPLASGLVRWA